ncbi:FAD-dependent monooxygenase [Actinomadura atramentaria]|uniref:FAD-dependent monooxygenase n=1 Tax=Actinomadura atramentaria TaxID=1990 RepID=UPI000524EDF5|nr:FAD-dependent monooxygenase [Actinomadura atramentaria]
MTKRILISGASIAGPALAYWLARYGHEVTVVERAPELRRGGQAIDFRGDVHRTVLEKMGILNEIRNHETGNGPLHMIDAEGRDLVTLPASFTGGDVEILRGDLARILYDRTRDSANYAFGDSIASLTDLGDAVAVTFESGRSSVYDLVVGADGLHSNVRRLAFGPETQFVKHSGYHVAVFEAPNRLHLDRDALLYSEPNRGLALYPIAGGTSVNVMCVFKADGATVDHRDTDAQKQLIADRFHGMAWHTQPILADLWNAPYFYHDSISTVRMPTWTSGRVALLGDAGYGATCGGTGAGLAIVCAYVLAGELATNPAHQAAFTTYEQETKKLTRACQRAAAGAGPFFAPKNIHHRTLLYKTLTKGPMLNLLNKLTTKATTAITLKNYPTPTHPTLTTF